MEFTGERYVPELTADSEISIFHMQRYASALKFCEGKNVLDAACGEGYGSNMISGVAKSVIGIDISKEAIDNATKRYGKENLKYINASVEKLPLEDNSIDVVISFETIEHVNKEVQNQFVEEIKRVLRKNGILIMSSPDKRNYSDIPNFHNEYHVCEMYRDEFYSMMNNKFSFVDIYYQGLYSDAYIKNEKSKRCTTEFTNIQISNEEEDRAEYILAVCSDEKQTKSLESSVLDNANFYYKQRDELGKIAKELETTKERLGEPGKIIEQKENYICEQRNIISEKDESIRELNGIIEQKENYICEQRELLSKIEEQIKSLEEKFAKEKHKAQVYESVIDKSLLAKFLIKRKIKKGELD